MVINDRPLSQCDQLSMVLHALLSENHYLSPCDIVEGFLFSSETFKLSGMASIRGGWMLPYLVKVLCMSLSPSPSLTKCVN